MKPRLLKEGGITQISLKNGKRLAKRLGAPVRVELHYSRSGEWYRVVAMYESGDSHEFTGFGWGYGGEGPRGLATWCEENGVPLDLRTIQDLDNQTNGLTWAWPVKE